MAFENGGGTVARGEIGPRLLSWWGVNVMVKMSCWTRFIEMTRIATGRLYLDRQQGDD
jgi:hypothetical protein